MRGFSLDKLGNVLNPLRSRKRYQQMNVLRLDIKSFNRDPVLRGIFMHVCFYFLPAIVHQRPLPVLRCPNEMDMHHHC